MENRRLTRAQARRAKKQQVAIELVAGGRKHDYEIAAQLGIDRRTLSRWKCLAHFRVQVDAICDARRKKWQDDREAAHQKRLADIRSGADLLPGYVSPTWY